MAEYTEMPLKVLTQDYLFTPESYPMLNNKKKPPNISVPVDSRWKLQSNYRASFHAKDF
jgi:hypothetical protein